MRLSKADIYNIIDTGRIDDMPAGTFIAGFEDFDGKYYPVNAIEADFYQGCECEMCTHLTHAVGGVVCFIRFLCE